MTHLDNLVADSLAQSPDTVVHQLASEVVRLRGWSTEGGRLFHKNCRSCICWNGDMCELISHICENGEQWRPSAEFVAAHPEVAVLADFAEEMRASASRFSVALDAVRADLAARDAEIAVDAGRLRDAAMRVWGEDAHGCDTPDRLADAILGLRAQIADLKRGGVDAAELDAIYDAIRCIGNNAYHASTGPAVPDALWDIRRRAYDVCARIDGIRTIPADRVLGEEEVGIGKELLSAYEKLWDMARIRCRPTTEAEFGRQWKKIDALRAQATTEKGGDDHHPRNPHSRASRRLRARREPRPAGVAHPCRLPRRAPIEAARGGGSSCNRKAEAVSRQIMTPERIAEIARLLESLQRTNFAKGFDGWVGLVHECLGALEAAQQEIADLKRGGVVVPDVVRGVTHTGISWEVSRPGDYYWERGAWREWKADGQMANASSFAWIRPFPVRPIPADRELMRLVDELIRWHGLRPLDKRPDHAAALVGAIKALRAQPTQELAP